MTIEIECIPSFISIISFSVAFPFSRSTVNHRGYPPSEYLCKHISNVLLFPVRSETANASTGAVLQPAVAACGPGDYLWRAASPQQQQ